MREMILLAHVSFGVACLLASVWVFVDTLNASEKSHFRTKVASRIAALSMWASFIAGGYWYVNYYRFDKKLILDGPWPFAHALVMETKEHLVISLLLLATFLPLLAAEKTFINSSARRLMLWISATTILLTLLMEGEGAVIAMGVKVALLNK